MTSKLQVDSLEGRTTKGSIVVMGESNGKTTNLQQGLAKYWGAGVAAGTSIEDSFNIGSLTDTQAGVQRWNYTNPMNSSNYSAFNSSTAGGGNADTIWNEKETTYQDINFHDDSSYADNRSNVGGFGDLA